MYMQPEPLLVFTMYIVLSELLCGGDDYVQPEPLPGIDYVHCTV
jgi:hypothetical protein